MRRGLIVRAATVLLALLVPLAGVRVAAPASCTDEDCDRPCCERDTGHATVLPVLPCCRAIAIDQASPHAAPTTVEHEQLPRIAPSPLAAPPMAIAVGVSSPPPSAAHLPAPPLYHQHCALLL